MLVGVPASGKSTWIKRQNFDWSKTVIISTDAYIEDQAALQGKTYSEVFNDEIKAATFKMNETLKSAIKFGLNIVIDQTNCSVKTRASKLSQFPKSYNKIAVFFPTPNEEELNNRLGSRPGKTIPDFVMKNMISSLVPPTEAEGFDKVITA